MNKKDKEILHKLATKLGTDDRDALHQAILFLSAKVDYTKPVNNPRKK